MKRLTKLTALLLSTVILSGVFTACNMVEEKESLKIYSHEFLLSRTGEPIEKAKRIQDEISRFPLKKAEESRFIPIKKLDGTFVGDEFYFYRNALKDNEKKAYDIIRNALLSGKDDFGINIPLPVKDAQNVYKAVIYDGADIFWAGTDLKIFCHERNKYSTSGFKTEFYNFPDGIKASEKKLVKALEKPLSDMWCLKSDYERVKYAHDYLIEKVTYDKNAEYAKSLYGAFVDGKADYIGYARAFQYLMQKSGVPCAYVAGKSHAWNVVLLDGEYYALDISLDDLDNEFPDTPYRFTYRFFNVTDEFLKDSKIHKKSVISRCIPKADGIKYRLDISFEDERFGTDFNYIKGEMPEISEDDDSRWWTAEATPWNRINKSWTKSDWNDEGNGIYSKYLPDVKRTYYWYAGNNTYYCIHDASNVLYVINTEKQSMAFMNSDYTTLPPPEEDIDNKTYTMEVISDKSTADKYGDNGWWNVLDSDWKKSDWVLQKDGVWRIYDSWNEVNYYWISAEKTYYAEFSEQGENKTMKLIKGTFEWEEVE